MKFTVSVTQDHIDAGEPCDPNSCPIALAMTDAGYNDVSVGEDEEEDQIEFSVGDTQYRARHTPESAQFINDFDFLTEVQPTSFEFEAEALN